MILEERRGLLGANTVIKTAVAKSGLAAILTRGFFWANFYFFKFGVKLFQNKQTKFFI
ncbi:MAG: hypothetical protein CM15mP106_5660 [Candidatus Neomarinimicrobiota bacterium]|nr:MAG: hypothetical protein CM15mP106_5660 [Candidatus Neomarinimicrobiota bacterium]